MDVVMGHHLPYITCYLLISLLFRIENKWRGYSRLKQDVNKSIRKVKLISKNVLESVAYYSRFNPLYYFKFIYFVQDLFFEAGEIEILDLYGLYHIWGKCNIWYSMVIIVD